VLGRNLNRIRKKSIYYLVAVISKVYIFFLEQSNVGINHLQFRTSRMRTHEQMDGKEKKHIHAHRYDDPQSDAYI